MTIMPMLMAMERVLPFVLFTLYLVTAVRVCTFSAWQTAGAPNPFLPRSLKPVARGYEKRLRFQAVA